MPLPWQKWLAIAVTVLASAGVVLILCEFRVIRLEGVSSPVEPLVAAHELHPGLSMFVSADGGAAHNASNLRAVCKQDAVSAEGKRVLHISRHGSTSSDFAHLLSSFSIRPDIIHPGNLWGYGMAREKADEISDSLLTHVLCASYDLILISDTTPDARPFFRLLGKAVQGAGSTGTPGQQGPDEARSAAGRRACGATIVVQLYNRFNYGIKDPNRYGADIRSALPAPNLLWVSHNAFEAEYMRSLAVPLPHWHFIRPLGFSRIPAKPVADQSAIAYIRDGCHFAKVAVPNILRSIARPNLKFAFVEPWVYGGPATLRQYRALVVVPYQLSLMRLYENIAHGVVTYIPSPSFFRALMQTAQCAEPKKALRVCEDAWESCVEYYHADLARYFYHFDSWEDLASKLTQSSVDPLSKSQLMLAEWPAHATNARHAWTALLLHAGVVTFT